MQSLKIMICYLKYWNLTQKINQKKKHLRINSNAMTFLHFNLHNQQNKRKLNTYGIIKLNLIIAINQISNYNIQKIKKRLFFSYLINLNKKMMMMKKKKWIIFIKNKIIS